MASGLVTTKVCSHCKEEKSLDEYSRHATTGDRRRLYCKACGVKMYQAWKAKNPSWEQAYRLRTKYGISMDEYNEILVEQENRCAICRSEFNDSLRRKLCVDHDHVTNEVRGLLCFNCNTLLGKAGDSVEILESAIKYLGGEDNR